MGEFDKSCLSCFCSVVRRLNQLRIDVINVSECVYQYYHINTQTVEGGKKLQKYSLTRFQGSASI